MLVLRIFVFLGFYLHPISTLETGSLSGKQLPESTRSGAYRIKSGSRKPSAKNANKFAFSSSVRFSG